MVRENILYVKLAKEGGDESCARIERGAKYRAILCETNYPEEFMKTAWMDGSHD